MVTKTYKAWYFKRVIAVLPVLIISLSFICNLTVYAASDSLKYYIGDGKDARVNTGKDNGYSGNNEIDLKDPHYGWRLGRFFVSGYTRVSEDANNNPVFLKTLGDKVTLWFNLEQDIENLNGNSKLTINEDKNGYDKYFEIEKTNFAHGTLIVRHTDWQNKAGEPTIYTDYLVANAELNADTQVELFEEGDYEIALNYEIRKDNFPLPDSYSNYRIFFKFSVRNGNCMVFPFDVNTKGELTNSSMTENGFYLDLAKSRYLDIDIKKEVLTESADGLTTDTRFNRPAKDGDQYTEEGIYTLTVSNRYTGEKTTKRIYVGTNVVLKAYVTTGLPIKEINAQLDLGAEINSDGTIVFPPSNVEITITDAQTHNPLAGAVFSVTNANGTNIGDGYTTGVDGKAVVPSLVPGSYVISMIQAPNNYILNEQPRIIEVTSDKVASATFTGIEFPSLSICKVDSTTGQFIAGAKFSVADGDNAIIAEVESLSTGAVTLEHMRPGTYTIIGTHDSNGNALSDDTQYIVEIRDNGSVYYNGTALEDNTLTFQSVGTSRSEDAAPALSEALSTDAGDAQTIAGPERKSASNAIALYVAIAIVVVSLAIAIVLIRRRSSKLSATELSGNKTRTTNSDMEDNDK